jgi:diguanylate cyclase (GGDEF)-like protein
MQLRRKLFYSFFFISAILLVGMFTSLYSLHIQSSDARIKEAFSRAQSHFLDLRLQQTQTLRLATTLLSKNSKWIETLSESELQNALSSLPVAKDPQRNRAESILFVKEGGEIISSTFTADESRYLVETLGLDKNPKDFMIVALQKGIYRVAVSQVLQKEKSGWLVAGFPLNSQDIDSLRASTGLDFIFFSKSGASKFIESGRIPLSLENLTDLQKLTGDGGKITLAESDFHGRILSLSDSPNVETVALMPMNIFQKEMWRLLQAFILGILILLSLSYLLTKRLAKSISKPFHLLRDSVREISNSMGIEYTKSINLNEFQQIAENYRSIAIRLKDELNQRLEANEKLEDTKFELLKANSRLSRRLFQNNVMLTLWNEQEKSQDTKEFLSKLLETLLPGVPFDYGCVIIRPIAELGAETILAKVEREKIKTDSPDDGVEKKDRTFWISELDSDLRSFLLNRSQESKSGKILSLETTTGAIGSTDTKRKVGVLTLALRQGKEHLGSLHLITDDPTPSVSENLQQFLINVSAQVAVLLHNRALSHASRVDSLTRLFNRGYMNDRLREELLRSSRTGLPFTFLLLDVDHFKKVNDEFGHRAGDAVLVGLASLLKRTCRASDVICRYGGEEIAIILVDTPLSGAKIFADNLRKLIEKETFIFDTIPLKITVSIGLAEYPTHGNKGEDVIQRSDQALYLAKSSGRNALKIAE